MNPQKEKPNALLIHVHLEGISPQVWRRILVPPDLSLGELHHVLQAVMGWDDTHLHDFRQGKGRAKRRIASTSGLETDLSSQDVEVPDEHDVKVSEVLTRKGSTITYMYDYGDNWAHALRLEDRVADEGPLPRCIEGERAGPPEDCGGVPGYRLCLKALKNPKSDPERAEWLEDWTPEHFDLEEINLEIADRLNELELDDNLMAPEVLEFLVSPEDFGVTAESVERFKDAAADLGPLLPDAPVVAGRLVAPDAGFPDGVLTTMEPDDIDGLWTITLYESTEDYLQETPGEAHEPRRSLAVYFQSTDLLPTTIRRLVGPGVLPVPMVLLTEGIMPPNHEELDLLSACLQLLAESIGQWDTEDALPPSASRTFDITDKKLSVEFIPDADLLGEANAEPMGLSLGYDELDREPKGEDEDISAS